MTGIGTGYVVSVFVRCGKEPDGQRLTRPKKEKLEKIKIIHRLPEEAPCSMRVFRLISLNLFFVRALLVLSLLSEVWNYIIKRYVLVC